MKVLVSPRVRSYLYELSEILHDKEYFGFLETAEKYVEELFKDIETSLPYKLKHIAPQYFERYGKKLFYATFVKNKHTTWYVFFSTYQNVDNELIYLVTYISNNHVIGHLLD
ncbi:MAG: hypothetical protein GX102_02350 [Porphyromonadaceae bacterium]|jgi:uncharacterized protein involved in tolerance to divalent cations|nr:hypothetical protein [Porphyromonadaceae bacterium]